METVKVEMGITENEIMADMSLLQELAKKGNQPTPKRPRGFGLTAKEYAEYRDDKISEAQARKFLNKRVDEGDLEKTYMSQGRGAPVAVYHKGG